MSTLGAGAGGDHGPRLLHAFHVLGASIACHALVELRCALLLRDKIGRLRSVMRVSIAFPDSPCTVCSCIRQSFGNLLRLLLICSAASREGVQARPGSGVLHVRDAVQPGPADDHVQNLRGMVSLVDGQPNCASLVHASVALSSFH